MFNNLSAQMSRILVFNGEVSLHKEHPSYFQTFRINNNFCLFQDQQLMSKVKVRVGGLHKVEFTELSDLMDFSDTSYTSKAYIT